MSQPQIHSNIENLAEQSQKVARLKIGKFVDLKSFRWTLLRVMQFLCKLSAEYVKKWSICYNRKMKRRKNN